MAVRETTSASLADYGYRYYDPLMGRWPSRDPLQEEAGFNLYVVLSNNAASATDYFGLITLDTPYQWGGIDEEMVARFAAAGDALNSVTDDKGRPCYQYKRNSYADFYAIVASVKNNDWVILFAHGGVPTEQIASSTAPYTLKPEYQGAENFPGDRVLRLTNGGVVRTADLMQAIAGLSGLLTVYACYHSPDINQESREAAAFLTMIKDLEHLAEQQRAQKPCACEKPYKVEYFVGQK